MASSQFAFHDELNDFLPTKKRGQVVILRYSSHQTIKHLIESIGVPHVEVGRVLLNSTLIANSLCPADDSLIDVFPEHTTPPSGLSFVVDNHLGRLAAYLRILGLDALYRNDYQDDEMAEIASQEERILLTRDRRLLMRKVVKYGYCIRHLEPLAQLGEVLRYYPVSQPEGASPPGFQRCLRCNTPLQQVSKQSVMDRLQPLTKLYYEEFCYCSTCDQVYWNGSHVEQMRAMISKVWSLG